MRKRIAERERFSSRPPFGIIRQPSYQKKEMRNASLYGSAILSVRLRDAGMIPLQWRIASCIVYNQEKHLPSRLMARFKIEDEGASKAGESRSQKAAAALSCGHLS